MAVTRTLSDKLYQDKEIQEAKKHNTPYFKKESIIRKGPERGDDVTAWNACVKLKKPEDPYSKIECASTF